MGGVSAHSLALLDGGCKTIIRATISQYYINQAVARGIERQKVQPGSVTFIQRFGGAINLNLHFHVIFLEGVYLVRTD